MTGVTARAAIALILVATALGGLAEAQLPARVGGQEVPTLAPLVKQARSARQRIR